MNEAIKLAIMKGGYKLKDVEVKDGEMFVFAPFNQGEVEMIATLDPLFWQALGMACGWGSEKILIDEPGHPKEWMYNEHCSVCGEIIVVQEEGCPDGCESDNAYVESWLYHALRFFELLMTGGDTEQFWSDLLKGNR